MTSLGSPFSTTAGGELISRQFKILPKINPLMPDPRNNRNFEMIFETSTNFMTVNKIPKKKLTYPPWGGCEGHVL